MKGTLGLAATHQMNALSKWTLGAAALAVGATVHAVFGPGYDGEDERTSIPLQPFEQEFIAKHVRDGQETTGFLVRKRANMASLRLFYRIWLPKQSEIKGVVVLVHGMKTHSGRIGVFLGSLLDKGFVVAAMDLEGHGRSEGRHCFFNDFNALVDDQLAFIELVKEKFRNHKLFLMGSSLGGLIVFHLLLKCKPSLVEGAVIQCPLIEVHPSSHPSFAVKYIGKCLRTLVPKLPIASGNRGKSSSAEVREAVEQRKREDPLYYWGRVRVGTGLAMCEGMELIQPLFQEIGTPFLLQHGTDDEACSVSGSESSFHKTSATDKTFKTYQGGQHDLLNEPPRISEAVIQDLVQWIEVRAT